MNNLLDIAETQVELFYQFIEREQKAINRFSAVNDGTGINRHFDLLENIKQEHMAPVIEALTLQGRIEIEVVDDDRYFLDPTIDKIIFIIPEHLLNRKQQLRYLECLVHFGAALYYGLLTQHMTFIPNESSDDESSSEEAYELMDDEYMPFFYIRGIDLNHFETFLNPMYDVAHYMKTTSDPNLLEYNLITEIADFVPKLALDFVMFDEEEEAKDVEKRKERQEWIDISHRRWLLLRGLPKC